MLKVRKEIPNLKYFIRESKELTVLDLMGKIWKVLMRLMKLNLTEKIWKLLFLIMKLNILVAAGFIGHILMATEYQ